MQKITFDTNILIDIEEKREGYEDILKIIELHNNKKITISIPAIIASEKLIEKNKITNFNIFKNYITNLDFKDIDILKPLCYPGLAFLDYCVLAGKTTIELDHKIHRILFPEIELEHTDYCLKRNLTNDHIYREWKNAKVDVLIMWCHIFYGNDIFITRDNNFKKHIKELSEIANINIMTPKEFVSNLNE